MPPNFFEIIGNTANLFGSIILLISVLSSRTAILSLCSIDIQCTPDGKNYNTDLAKSLIEQRYNAVFGAFFITLGFTISLLKSLGYTPNNYILYALLIITTSFVALYFFFKRKIINSNFHRMFEKV